MINSSLIGVVDLSASWATGVPSLFSIKLYMLQRCLLQRVVVIWLAKVGACVGPTLSNKMLFIQ
jgi:hypothetical protein